jgi:hypothetical protein
MVMGTIVPGNNTELRHGNMIMASAGGMDVARRVPACSPAVEPDAGRLPVSVCRAFWSVFICLATGV